MNSVDRKVVVQERKKRVSEYLSVHSTSAYNTRYDLCLCQRMNVFYRVSACTNTDIALIHAHTCSPKNTL